MKTFGSLIFTLFFVSNVIAIELSIDNSLVNNEHNSVKQVYGLIAMGDDDSALLLAKQITNKNPYNIEIYRLMANICYRKNDLKSAKSVLKKILKISKNDNESLEFLAQIYYDIDNDKQAQNLLTNLEKGGQILSSNSYKILAKIYERQGDCDNALSYLNKSSSIRGNGLEQAMMIKNCLKDNSLYLHGDLTLNKDEKPNRFNSRRSW
jgi:predicted Zn-dependent protease